MTSATPHPVIVGVDPSEQIDPDVVLRDGEVVHVREVQASDEDGVLALLDHLSPESSRRRFFTGAANLTAAAHWATESNPDRVGLVAMSASGEVVGHGVFVRMRGHCAEMAFEVAEDHRRRGLAGALLDRLAQAARDLGITVMLAEVLPENADMLAVFREHFITSEKRQDGVIHVTFAVTQSSERKVQRERLPENDRQGGTGG